MTTRTPTPRMMTTAPNHVGGVTVNRTMWSPDRDASLRGIRVLTANLLDSRGLWLPERRTILLKRGLTSTTRKCVLAHELAHAYYGDDCSTPDRERRANRWAANRLITADDVARCSQDYPGHPEQWCERLQVTDLILLAWLQQPKNMEAVERSLAASHRAA